MVGEARVAISGRYTHCHPEAQRAHVAMQGPLQAHVAPAPPAPAMEEGAALRSAGISAIAAATSGF